MSMQDNELVDQLNFLRRRVAELEAAEADFRRNRKTLQQLSSVVQQTEDQVVITNKEGVIEYVNPAFERLTGYSKQEALGNTPRILKSGRHDEQFYKNLWDTILSGRPFRAVLTNRKKNGELYYEEKTITPIKDTGGQITHFVSTGKDITNRKRFEEMIQQRNRELALINKASQAFIAVLDIDQILTTLLEGVQHLLDVSLCSAWLLEGEPPALVCRQVSTPQALPIIGWRLKPGQGLAGWTAAQGKSVVVADAQQDRRYYQGIEKRMGFELRSIVSVPLKAKQETIGVLQVMDTRSNRFDHADLTLLESLVATAAVAIDNARLYHQAQQEAATKAALLKEVNHRVKNNLAAIVGLLYAEQRHIKSSSAITRQGRQIYQTLMNDLISRVQGLATVHSMLSATQWEPLLLAQLVKQVVQSAAKMAPPSQKILIDVSESPVRVAADQAHNLALIINELAINAIKHATTGDNVTQITVTILSEDDRVTIEFRDNGPGFPAKILQTTDAFTSIGFELVQNVVRRSLRGTLHLGNNHGAVVTIKFREKPSDSSPPVQKQPVCQKGYRYE
ncbi:MAG: PAS domain S-box protein [Chloroflexi bacterium]|nr:MAG: PAS domain S-box protein [Chloroflexota bacterium]